MYKGKFDQKNRQSNTNTKDLLAQRQQGNAARSARNASRPAAPGQTPRPQSANPQRPVPSAMQNQRRNVPAEPVVVQKSGPKIGGVIFYTLYFMFILGFFAATYFGLNWLNGWLSDYEASQPTVKAEQVFQQLFNDPDWAALYVAAGVEDTPYEGKEAFVTYMDTKLDGQKLTYLETSAGLSGDKKYVVRLNDERIATFTLVDKNNVGEASLENLEEITSIADWQLGSIELFFTRSGTFRIEKMDDCTALVNGVELNDDFTIQRATTIAESYLPAGTPMPSTSVQEISGLLTVPTVTILDAKGKETEVTYDEATRTFTQRTTSNTISAEQEAAVRGADETYCRWMIKAVTNRNTVAQYYDKTSDAYNDIVRTTELWMQDYKGYDFSDHRIAGFTQYTDNLFSVRSSLNLNITRTDGTVKEHNIARSLVFQKNDSGQWLCIRATNVDITQPKGKVRLTFMLDDTQILSTFFETDAGEISTPTVAPVPEGKVFAGWFRQETDASGTTTLSLVFQPDEDGKVLIPEGTTLVPMTLYALFEDSGSTSTQGGES